MNKEQILGFIRQALPLLGMFLITRGHVTEEQFSELSENLLQAAGAAITLGSIIWSYLDKTDKNIVAKAIDLPDVAKIECHATKGGAELANSIPHEDVVVGHPKLGLEPIYPTTRAAR